MEVSIFPKLTDLLKNFVEIRLHTDGGENKEKHQEYQLELTKSQTIPAYVILDPGKPHEPLDTHYGADLTGATFGAFLRRNSD